MISSVRQWSAKQDDDFNRARLRLCLRVKTHEPIHCRLPGAPLRLLSSPEYRLCGRSLRTAIPKAFFCPIATTSFLPRVTPV